MAFFFLNKASAACGGYVCAFPPHQDDGSVGARRKNEEDDTHISESSTLTSTTEISLSLEENTSPHDDEGVIMEVRTNPLDSNTIQAAIGQQQQQQQQQKQADCDFDSNCSRLFQWLRQQRWQEITDLLEEEEESAAQQARRWVIRRESSGKLRWRMLPLHASIVFGAPYDIVESLTLAYPPGVFQKDDRGMLPLHLAFRHGATNEILAELIRTYPQSISVQDRKGRIPLHCIISPPRKASTPIATSHDSQKTKIEKYANKHRTNVISLYATAACAAERNRNIMALSTNLPLQPKETTYSSHQNIEDDPHSTLRLKSLEHQLQQEQHQHELIREELRETKSREQSLQSKLRELVLAFSSQIRAHEAECASLKDQLRQKGNELQLSRVDVSSESKSSKVLDSQSPCIS
eukprot:scaffold254901_cov48-Attheya_sp.AAC.1